MINPGPYLRKNFPSIYFFLVSVINFVKESGRPYTIYITDSLGGSFKDYFLITDMNKRIADLKRGLDDESIKTIDVILQRFIYYPDEKHRHRMPKNSEIIGGLLPVETDESKRLIERDLKVVGRNIKFPAKHIEESVFYFHHGLILLPPLIRDYIKGHDFIDAGAFTGDSAIALNKYGYRKIYSIEISQKSIKKYKENLAANNINTERYEIINAGIAAGDGEMPVSIADTGSSGFSLIRKTGKYDEITVQKRTLDNIASEYNISPRFIKADIEGNGLDFVKGASLILKRSRPVVSIAIYHNPSEFFGVKPLLEEMLPDYVFIIRKLATGIMKNLCHSEIILLGYPKEILAADQQL